MSNEQNFSEKNVFEKKSFETILSEANSVDPKKIASEVLEWIVGNTENFVDDNMKVFKIDLVLDSKEGMTETKKLQDLYRAIPDDEELPTQLIPGDEDLASFKETEERIKKDLEKAFDCRRILDGITEKAYTIMTEDKESLGNLFNKLIFYYEKIIPNPENKIKAYKIDEEIRGLLSKKDNAKSQKTKDGIQKKILTKIDEGIKLLHFQKFDGLATILKFEYESFDVGVQIRDPKNKEVKREYSIPEGFTIWIELSYGIKKRQTAIF